MILAIDIGNTNIEFGVFEEKKIKCKFRIGTNREATSDDIGLKLRQFLFINNIEIEEIKDVIIETVVPQVMYSITNAIKKYLCKKPIIIGEDFIVPITNKYDNPSSVGGDRLVNAYSALKKYGAPLIIVDFGTATTFDAINVYGEYEGGAIFTGIRISTDALFQKTAKLPRVEIAHTDKVIAKSTVTSIQSGILYGYVGAVENIVKMMKKELGDDTKVIATGGLSKLIGNETSCFDELDSNLILDGIIALYDEYKNLKNI